LKECTNRLKEMLPWYLNKTLSEDEVKQVEAHLKECPECRKELEEIIFLSSEVKVNSEVFASPHIESERLVLFCEEPKSLSPDESISIERHLRSCLYCYEELQTLKRANLELKSLERETKPKLVKEASVWEKISERLIWLVRKPVLAYIIVILLAYPAASWLLRSPKSGESIVPKVAFEKVYMLSEQTRTTVEPTSVFRKTKDILVRVVIPFWADIENESYNLAINDENSKSILAIKDFTDFGNQGFFQLVLNTDSISDGRYTLVVWGTNKKDPAISSETNFPFQIITMK